MGVEKLKYKDNEVVERSRHCLTYDDTQIAKGLLIILMVVHHLFAFPDRIGDNSFISVIPFLTGENTPEFQLGLFGRICVAGFLFLSGFGMTTSLMSKPKNLIAYVGSKYLAFYQTYWLIFLCFIPIGLIFFNAQIRYQFDWQTFLLNFIGWSDFYQPEWSYNPEWWFVKPYLLLLLLFPLATLIIRKSPFALFLLSNLALVVAYKLNFGNDLAIWQFPFIIGMIFAYKNLFEQLPMLFNPQVEKNQVIHAIAIFLIIFILRNKAATDVMLDGIFAPFIVYYGIRLIPPMKIIRNSIVLLGKYSFQIWLIHSFFCYYYFSNLVFLPKLSPLVTIWLLLLSLGSALVITFVENKFKLLSMRS